jgi:hypothetical protein
MKRFSLGLSHFVFAGVLVWRLAVLGRLTASPYLLPLRGDMHFYNDWAQSVLNGRTTDHLAFYGLPGYPYLLALLYKIFGYNPFVPGFIQAGLEAGTSVLIYQLTLPLLLRSGSREIASTHGVSNSRTLNHARFVALAAALAWAFFVPAEAYAAILMPTAWFVFAFWLVVWRIFKKESGPNREECLLLGLLIGISAMAVATILILVLLILVALLIKPNDGVKDTPTRALTVRVAILLAAIGLGTSPAWIHNYFIGRDPVFLSAHSGINFWIGNNPSANGYPHFPPGLRAGQAAMLQDSITQAELAAGHPLKRSEVSAYWSGKARNYITTNFGSWLKSLVLKVRNFWNAFQYDDLSIITVLRDEGVIFPGLYFGVVAALAIPGMLLAWSLVPQSRWIIAAIALSMLALLTVFVTERYRIVAVPGLLILAAFGLSLFWQACRKNQLRTVAIYLALVVGSTIFVAWPQRNPSLWALDAYNSGWQALESNHLPLAEQKLAIAYAYVPTNSETIFALGNLRLAEGKLEQAQSFYDAALTIDPQHRGALNNLGVMALTAGRYDAAENWLRRAQEVDPRNAKTHYLLAQVLLARRDLENARKEIDRAIELDPSQPEFAKLRQRLVEQ